MTALALTLAASPRAEYKLVAKKGEGTFSEVLKAQSIKSGKAVAIKCMKNHFDSLDQVNNLREIQALHRLSPHPNIIRLMEVLYDGPTGRLALVFELMDMNVYELIRGRRHYVAEDRVTAYMYQLMKAMDHMHRNGIFHRDIKPENILLCDDVLKLADFGSCRGIYSKQPYTEYISTRWYRAPECLLTDGYYNYKMDMWGVGCVFFEIVSLYPLFPGTNELDQVSKIHAVIGTPPAALVGKMKQRSAHCDFNFPRSEGSGIAPLIPHASPECIDLIVQLLQYDPDARMSARQALRHPYFRELREQDKRQQAALLAAQAAAGAPDGGRGAGQTPPGDVRASPAEAARPARELSSGSKLSRTSSGTRAGGGTPPAPAASAAAATGATPRAAPRARPPPAPSPAPGAAPPPPARAPVRAAPQPQPRAGGGSTGAPQQPAPALAATQRAGAGGAAGGMSVQGSGAGPPSLRRERSSTRLGAPTPAPTAPTSLRHTTKAAYVSPYSVQGIKQAAMAAAAAAAAAAGMGNTRR